MIALIKCRKDETERARCNKMTNKASDVNAGSPTDNLSGKFFQFYFCNTYMFQYWGDRCVKRF